MVADLEKAAGPGGYQPPESMRECNAWDVSRSAQARNE
jgi:hypothetical protein